MSDLKSIIQKLDIEGASEFVSGKSVEELQELLFEYAFDERDIRAYTLMVGLINRDPKWEWHYLASLILCQPLCSLNGAYFAAYHHALEAVKLAPSDGSLKEYALFFNVVPDKPMDNATAKSMTEDLLKIDSNNQVAIRIVKRLGV